MSNLVGTVGGGTSTVAYAGVPSVVPAASSTSTTTTTSSAPQSSSQAATGQSPLLTQKLIVDSVAGVVSEFVDSSGVVQTQTPSKAVVAYLKAGLTAEGFTKHSNLLPQSA